MWDACLHISRLDMCVCMNVLIDICIDICLHIFLATIFVYSGHTMLGNIQTQTRVCVHVHVCVREDVGEGVGAEVGLGVAAQPYIISLLN